MPITFEDARTQLVADLEIYSSLCDVLDLSHLDREIQTEATTAVTVAGKVLARSLGAFVAAAREKGIKP